MDVHRGAKELGQQDNHEIGPPRQWCASNPGESRDHGLAQALRLTRIIADLLTIHHKKNNRVKLRLEVRGKDGRLTILSWKSEDSQQNSEDKVKA